MQLSGEVQLLPQNTPETVWQPGSQFNLGSAPSSCI